MTEPVREQMVHDGLEPCPYLEGQVSRMPLRWQFQDLAPAEVDASLAAGDRRVGRMLYRTRCPACSACQPLRIPVAEFVPSRSQRRVLRRNRDLRIELAPATYSDEKLALYNRHKMERGLGEEEKPMSRRGYEGWFLRSCVRTREMRYYRGDRLIGVGILDLGARDTSSVYFYFDPDESHRSLGTLSVLVEVEWLRRAGGRYHYLGLYVADCRHLNYKARFFPHERLIDGRWMRFPARDAPAVPAPGEAGPTG
ncbi:MAG: arginyltransferase [Deltaproteobacteria bacterium]|nr:MAG: arginyltransferase [Deltaproteobacteria bacterium]